MAFVDPMASHHLEIIIRDFECDFMSIDENIPRHISASLVEDNSSTDVMVFF